MDPEDLQGDTCSLQKDDASTDDNRCTHCEFKAHSPPLWSCKDETETYERAGLYCMAVITML